MNEYEKLVAQGVPPAQAARTIYEAIKDQDVPATPVILTPRPKTKSQTKVKMASQADVESGGPGRPTDPASRSRMLCAVLLAQSYQTRDYKTLTRDQLQELMTAAYEHDGLQPKDLPAMSTLGTLMTKLRKGQVSGYPAMEIKGPIERTWNGVRQPLITVYARDRSRDLSLGILDLTRIPAWVLK